MMRFPLKVSPQNLRIFGLIVVLICVLLFFSTQIHNYLNKDLFIRVSTSVAIMALIAIGQTLVILTRNIDLSVGSIVGFSAFFLGGLLARNPNINPSLVILAGVGFGSLFGMLNGFLVAYANVPSIIVTLGTMALYRSSLVQFSGAKSISTASLPHWLVSLPQMNVISVAGYDIRVTEVVEVQKHRCAISERSRYGCVEGQRGARTACLCRLAQHQRNRIRRGRRGRQKHRQQK